MYEKIVVMQGAHRDAAQMLTTATRIQGSSNGKVGETRINWPE